MNRVFAAFNFCGVVILAVLCVIQWRVNSRVNQRADELELKNHQQTLELDKDQQTIKTYTADLEDFRGRLSLSEKQLKELDSKLTVQTRERDQLVAERDNLKLALGKWEAAVADRDKTINQARAELQQYANDRNDAAQKLSDLTVKWNALVKQWNDQQAKR